MSVEDLVTRLAPELLPARKGRGFLLFTALVAVAAFAVIWERSLTAALLTGSVIAVVVGGLMEASARRYHRLEIKWTLIRLAESPSKIYQAIANNFREEILVQRERTLGRESEWYRARQPLKKAADEANRSVAYWRQRLTQEPADEPIRSQLDTAERLGRKFRDALGQLDHRSEALLAFFNDCEARIALQKSVTRLRSTS